MFLNLRKTTKVEEALGDLAHKVKQLGMLGKRSEKT